MRRESCLLLVLLTAACKREAATAAPPPPQSVAAPAPARSAPGTLAASADAAARDTQLYVDLLYMTQADIAVSSTVANPRDFPEHLLDYRPDTAWNGKTGDLVGGWVAFRVPKSAHVERIEMTVGFDKIARDGTDLFTANHRIRRVRVSLDGQSIGEHELDIDKRTAQHIKVGRPGGEYKIEVLETAAGTNKTWRELVVSELHVIGVTEGVERRTGEQPRVRVGSLDPPSAAKGSYSEAIGGTFPSIDAFCATQRELARPLLKAAAAEMAALFGTDLVRPSCQSLDLRIKPELAPPFLELAAVAYNDVTENTTAILRSESGWRLAPELWSASHSPLDTGCPVHHFAVYPISIETKPTTPPILVVTSQTEVVGTPGSGMSDMTHWVTRNVTTCRLARGELLCDRPPTRLFRDSVDEFPSLDPGMKAKLPKGAAFHVTPDGHVALDTP
jgi:hypothetical protein